MKKGHRYMRGIFLKSLVQKRAKSGFFCTADIAKNHNDVMQDSHTIGFDTYFQLTADQGGTTFSVKILRYGITFHKNVQNAFVILPAIEVTMEAKTIFKN